MLRHIQNRLQHGSTLAVPKYFGPTYKFREYSQAMERHGGYDIYEAQALRILDPNLFHSFQSPISDSRRAVIPIEGFEGISDKRRASCPSALPSSLANRVNARVWQEQVKPYIDDGLSAHWNVPWIHYLPTAALVLFEVVFCAVLYMTISYYASPSSSSSSRREMIRWMIGLVLVCILFVALSFLYMLLDNVKNIEIERRCSELSDKLKGSNISFAFFATRHLRWLKPLKYLVVYFETDDWNSGISTPEGQLTPSVIQLNVLQRRYTLKCADEGLPVHGVPPSEEQSPECQQAQEDIMPNTSSTQVQNLSLSSTTTNATTSAESKRTVYKNPIRKLSDSGDLPKKLIVRKKRVSFAEPMISVSPL